jgi:hypothetical protein
MNEADLINGMDIGRANDIVNARGTSLQNYLVDTVNELINQMREQLDKEDINASYRLRQSLEPNISPATKNSLSVEIIANDYWKYVNYGVNGTKRNNGAPAWGSSSGQFPKIEDIIQWMRFRSIIPRQGQTMESTAWVIRRAIIENGKEARPFFSRVVENKTNIKVIESGLTKIFKRAIEVNISGKWQ